jgi:hypothetical protein
VTNKDVLDMSCYKVATFRENNMKKSVLFGLALGVSTLVACPAPPEQTGAVPNQGPDGQGQPHMENGPGEHLQGPQTPDSAGADGGAEANADTTGLPNFDALIAAGAETVTVSGQVDGVAAGFVDFQIAHTQGGWVVPKIVHQAVVTDGAFSAQVPQGYTVGLYIVVVDDANGDGAGPGDRRIPYSDVVNVGTDDISLVFDSDAAASWEGIFSSLPDLDDGNPVLDGPPPGAELNPTPVNPTPDGAESNPGGLGTPNPADNPEEDE